MAVHHGGKVGSAAKKLAASQSARAPRVKLERHWLITRRSTIDLSS